jgi:hypothetical protein
MRNDNIDINEFSDEIDQAIEVKDKSALESLLADLKRAKKRAFPKKRYYKGEKVYSNLPAFIKCCELEAKIYGLLNGVPADIGDRQEQISQKVLADAKLFSRIAIPKLLEQDRQTDTEGEK